MSAPHPAVDEMYQLVDDLYDHGLDATRLARIEALIAQSPRNLQAYVERFDFHCELMDQSDHQPDELAALHVLHQSAGNLARRERRQHRQMLTFLGACVMLVLLGGSWMFSTMVLQRIPVGTIASLSMDFKTDSIGLELGQVIHRGETVSLLEGIVSIQLPDVMVDLIGPGTFRIERNKVFLTRGTIVAKVEPQGIGFTVRTPEVETMDLGTEFLVRHRADEGSYVSVRRGAARARQLDWRGQAVKELDLTTSRAAKFLLKSRLAQEVAYVPEDYLQVERSRGGIQRLSGAIRTVAEQAPASLAGDQLTTPNHLLVIPERQLILDQDLTVTGLSGPVTIPAGATVGSYLVHYDPTLIINSAPRGALTFTGQIAAVIGSSQELNATDLQFGLSGTMYENQPFRELELDEDEVRISDDRKTVSFFFGITPPEFLDEARVLVVLAPP